MTELTGILDPNTETYLGDGVYASFDGYQIKLRTPRENGAEHVIFLEDEVLHALADYIEQLKAAVDEYKAGLASQARAGEAGECLPQPEKKS